VILMTNSKNTTILKTCRSAKINRRILNRIGECLNLDFWLFRLITKFSRNEMYYRVCLNFESQQFRRVGRIRRAALQSVEFLPFIDDLGETSDKNKTHPKECLNPIPKHLVYKYFGAGENRMPKHLYTCCIIKMLRK